jgi:hypothetical protein
MMNAERVSETLETNQHNQHNQHNRQPEKEFVAVNRA